MVSGRRDRTDRLGIEREPERAHQSGARGHWADDSVVLFFKRDGQAGPLGKPDRIRNRVSAGWVAAGAGAAATRCADSGRGAMTPYWRGILLASVQVGVGLRFGAVL